MIMTQSRAKAGEASTGATRPAQAPGRHVQLLLASRSPRRRELLLEHGVAHRAEHPGIDDGQLAPGRVEPSQWVASLAYLKAAAAQERFAPELTGQDWLVLGADTVCVKDGELIGQPLDAADAERIIRKLENGSHEVITGVALVPAGAAAAGGGEVRELFVDRARVRVGTIGEPAIREYIQSGQWRGKAGAYNLRERIEAGWPIQYEGDPTTVMGLPMRALMARLQQVPGLS